MTGTSGQNASFHALTPRQFFQVPSRILPFIKTQESSRLKVTYTDTFGIAGNNNSWASATWELVIQSVTDPSMPQISAARTTVYSDFPNTSGWRMQPGVVSAYVNSLPAGAYQMYVRVARSDNSQGCYTGYGMAFPAQTSDASTFMLEVQELP